MLVIFKNAYCLRTLRQTYKGKNLSDGKCISGKARLTDRAINLIQNYFRIAIRQNSGVPSMKNATYLCHSQTNRQSQLG